MSDSTVDTKSTGNKAVKFIKSLLFYMTLLFILVMVAFTVQSDQARSLFGFSMFNIETTSMQSVIPQGSLVITKSLDAKDYSLNDDITFFDPEITKSMVTHRIVDIDTSKNFIEFETKGVDNPEPDLYWVPEANIMGKVILTIPMLGVYLLYVQQNIFVVVGLLVIFYLMILAIQNFIKVSKETKNTKNEGDLDGQESI